MHMLKLKYKFLQFVNNKGHFTWEHNTVWLYLTYHKRDFSCKFIPTILHPHATNNVSLLAIII
jgi:hypothetical protein